MCIPPADALLAEARTIMGDSDLVLLFIGLNNDLESKESALQMPGFERGDGTGLEVPEPQRLLLRAALDSGRPVVVVLTTAGRSPVTFYRAVDQMPPFDDYAMAGRTYRFFTGQPLYRFGYGLSYASFRYEDLLWQGPAMPGGQSLMSARVTNVSQRDGDEVVQL